MVIAYVSVLVCLLGLLVFVLSKTNADVKRLGEHMFWCGLLTTLMSAATHAVRLF